MGGGETGETPRYRFVSEVMGQLPETDVWVATTTAGNEVVPSDHLAHLLHSADGSVHQAKEISMTRKHARARFSVGELVDAAYDEAAQLTEMLSASDRPDLIDHFRRTVS